MWGKCEAFEFCFSKIWWKLAPITRQYYLRAKFYNPVVARFTQEDILDITLPIDFKEISKFFSGGDLWSICNYDFKVGEWYNIVDKTINLYDDFPRSNKYYIYNKNRW